MLNYLFKNILITDTLSPFNGQLGDMSVNNGVITQFSMQIDATNFDQIIDCSNCFATPSFVDVRCNSTEPGHEQRDTFESLNHTALAGGYSHIALLPNSFPARNAKADIEFVVQHNNHNTVSFLPLGTITKNMEGNDLSELYDMQKSGAVAFSNADNSIENSGTLSKALLYSKNFDGLIYSFCFLSELSKGAYVAEGTVALSLGLKGIPQMAEYLQVQRDIELADYHQHRIHLSKISTERSVEAIRQAKLQGIKVTCDVAVMNLVLTDEAIMDFDSMVKLMPPLRSANDVKALWEGLKDGTIDAICTDHQPLEIEKKDLEFEYADFGALTMQTAFSLAIEGRNRFMPGLDDDILLNKFNYDAAKILNVKLNTINIGETAGFNIINPTEQTKLNDSNNRSLSKNTFYYNKPLPYKMEGIFIKNNYNKF